MRIQTINRKLNDAQHDINYMLGELELKLVNYIQKNTLGTVMSVTCYKVQIKSEIFLSKEDVDEIQELFMLELKQYNAAFDSNKILIDVWYEFAHKKPS